MDDKVTDEKRYCAVCVNRGRTEKDRDAEKVMHCRVYNLTGEKICIEKGYVSFERDSQAQESPKAVSKIFCDRCGEVCKPQSNWGNCTLCGDNICENCIPQGFDDNGCCGTCGEHNKEAPKAAKPRIDPNLCLGCGDDDICDRKQCPITEQIDVPKAESVQSAGDIVEEICLLSTSGYIDWREQAAKLIAAQRQAGREEMEAKCRTCRDESAANMARILQARYAAVIEAADKAQKSMDDFAKGFRDDSVAAQWAKQVATDIRKALADLEARKG
jgi:hypothetical protein